MMEAPKILPQHEWLARLVGEWRSQMDLTSPDGSTSLTLHGTESVRMIGDLWLQMEGRGDMPGGGKSHQVLTAGFNPETGRFIGTWIGSMMNHFWIYDGELDATGKVLTLWSEGPRCDGGEGMTRYRDVITIIDDNHRTLTGNMLTPDGTWEQLMLVDYYRV